MEFVHNIIWIGILVSGDPIRRILIGKFHTYGLPTPSVTTLESKQRPYYGMNWEKELEGEEKKMEGNKRYK